MRGSRSLAFVALTTSLGCGGRTELITPRADAETDVVARDTGWRDATADMPAPSSDCAPPEAACAPVQFRQPTAAACAIQASDSCALDGEAFGIDADAGRAVRVFAMDRWGSGHLIVWCDGTYVGQLFTRFDVRSYLGRRSDARVASVGTNACCLPGQGCYGYPMPTWVTYLGSELPASYAGHPDRLAADWDALVLCPGLAPPPTAFPASVDDVRAFVADYHRGAMLVLDYYRPGVGPIFDEADRLLASDGLSMDRVWVEPGVVAIDHCVPDAP